MVFQSHSTISFSITRTDVAEYVAGITRNFPDAWQWTTTISQEKSGASYVTIAITVSSDATEMQSSSEGWLTILSEALAGLSRKENDR